MKPSLHPISSLLPKCLARLILEDERFAQKGPISPLRCRALGSVCTQRASEPIPRLRLLEGPFPGGPSLQRYRQTKVPIAEQRDLREKKNGKEGCLKRPFFCSRRGRGDGRDLSRCHIKDFDRQFRDNAEIPPLTAARHNLKGIN